MRERKTVIDRPLTDVLDNPTNRTERRRAKSLVSQIQRHYESVRSTSLRSVRTPGSILDSALERLQQFDSNISLNKPQSAPSSTSSKRDQGHWETKTRIEWHRWRVRARVVFSFAEIYLLTENKEQHSQTKENENKTALLRKLQQTVRCVFMRKKRRLKKIVSQHQCMTSQSSFLIRILVWTCAQRRVSLL